jgi:hypothetical protein
MPAIQSITDDLLIDAINRATQRVVLIAPGVWPPLANAIAKAWQRLGPKNVTAILDVDPEICRIGYGSLAGLEILQKAATAAGEPLGGEPGVRICVVIADDQTFVFSPTPRQLEAPPGKQPVATTPQPLSQPKANGIVLAKPPATLETELGSGPDGETTRTLGLDVLDPKKLAAVKQDLEQNPPKNFDLARAVNVYNARVQFVELKLGGCKLSEHKAQLPDHLIQVLKKNPVLSKKIGKNIKLIDEDDVLVTDPKLSQATLFKRRETIQNQYLRPVRGVGTVIERSKKADFSIAVESLKAEVAKFAASVETKLAERFQETAEQLATEILNEVLTDLPERWRKKLGPHPDPKRVRWFVLEDLFKAFGTPAGKVGKMKVETVFKDVTYDMLTDAEFREQMAEYFPDLPLLEEFSAAKERPPAPPAPPTPQSNLFDQNN